MFSLSLSLSLSLTSLFVGDEFLAPIFKVIKVPNREREGERKRTEEPFSPFLSSRALSTADGQKLK
jgi:hypothetical protein